jgi:hypothetical protein
MSPTLILSEGAQPVRALDKAGARPIAADVSAVFLMNILLVVILFFELSEKVI